MNAGNTTGKHLTLPAGEGQPDISSGSIFFIGNATVLIRYAGFTVLTDPNFIHMHEEVPIGYGLTAKRLMNPAMEIADLPPHRPSCTLPFPRRPLRPGGRTRPGQVAADSDYASCGAGVTRERVHRHSCNQDMVDSLCIERGGAPANHIRARSSRPWPYGCNASAGHGQHTRIWFERR